MQSGVAIGTLLFLSVIVLPLDATETMAAPAHLGVPPGKKSDVKLLDGSQIARASFVGDTFSVAPLVQDSGRAFYMSDAAGPTQHTFDDINESGGTNLLGTSGGSFIVLEGVIPQGGGIDRVVVEVTALSSDMIAEPWVNSSHAGRGYISWRLDIGSNSGGTDPIEPEVPFTRVGSGFSAFNSFGQLLASFELSVDTSTATSLSGVAILGNSGVDIAGENVATIQMHWDIRPEPTDVALQLVDADDGAYLPASPLDVFVEIENLGPVTSSSTSIDLYASTDTNITDTDRWMGNFILPSISSGDSFGAYAPAQLPADITNGNYYIGGILLISDTDSSNNTNYDANPIVVSTDPAIRIRPLSLNFVEQAQAGTVATEGPGDTVTRSEMTRSVLPHLLERAESEGQVRVIVGFDTPFQPEGQLSSAKRQVQRQNIQMRASQLLVSLKGLSFKQDVRFRFIPFITLSVDSKALQHLANSPMVISIEEDSLSFPTLASSNNVIGSPLAWAEGYEGTGQAVVILDTGVDSTHPWFTTGGSKIVSEACYSSNQTDSVSLCPGGVTKSTAPGSGIHCDLSVTGCDHGTHVAGIAAGNNGTGPDLGVARGADIISMQVFSRVDSQLICEDDPAPCVTSFSSDQISALEQVFALKDSHDIAAVNMSLGGDQFFDQATCDAGNAAIKTAIDNLRSFNIATVIASGNDGWNDSISAPACVSSAISVGNTSDSDAVAPSSNIYPQIHLLAPGISVTSSVPGTGTAVFGGTSMSAPHVAGAWAVLKQINPIASVVEILALLQNTGTPVDDMRVGGTETDMPRINLDLAVGQPRTTFGIFNDGPAMLSISSIALETPAPWVSWAPQAPFDIQAGGLQVIRIMIDYASAPAGASQSRLLINSNDPEDPILPGGVFVNVTASGNILFLDGFED